MVCLICTDTKPCIVGICKECLNKKDQYIENVFIESLMHLTIQERLIKVEQLLKKLKND
jgi:hypothetical protein